jgi:phosphoserine phosphatase RsbU/P
LAKFSTAWKKLSTPWKKFSTPWKKFSTPWKNLNNRRAAGKRREDGAVRLLIAEDDAATRMLLAAVLKRRGFDVLEVENGEQAWEAMRADDAPRMAILDWMMPKLDGLEVVRRVRALEREHPPYLIMLTARGEKSDLVAGLDAGANDYLSKPFDPGELRARVEVGRRMVEMQGDLQERNEELSRWHEKMEEELRLAGQVQRNLLSTVAVFGPDFDVRFAYRPSLAIGGDFFDAMALPDGRLCLYVGDVSGHGVAPAMISTFMKMRTTDLVREHIDAGPAAVCRSLNQDMIEHNQGTDLYATLFLALYDPPTRRWRACNCGHPVPFLVGADGAVREGAVPAGGDLPLGIANRPTQYGADAEIEWTSEAGDSLVLFTDGTYEAVKARTGEMCGSETWRAVVEERVRARPQEPAPDGMLDLLERSGYDLGGDDCCVVAVRTAPGEGARVRREVANTLEDADEIALECEQALRGAGWSEEEAMEVRLMVAEYATNVVRHGHLGAGDRFDCSLFIDGGACRVFVRDAGRGWNLHGRMERSGRVPAYAEGGRGLDIIRSVASRIDFCRMERYNHARLTVVRKSREESTPK